MPPFIDFGGLYRACMSIQRYILLHAWGNIRLIQAWQSSKPPELDNQVDGPGVQPTRLNTRPWQVRKGHPL